MLTQVTTHPILVMIQKQDQIVFSLDHDEFTVGRSIEADIYIPHAQVSRIQAVIRRDKSSRYHLIDGDGQGCGSRNGTYVNWERVQHRVLEVGDVICFGSPTAVAQFNHAETAPKRLRPEALVQNTDHLSTQLVFPMGFARPQAIGS